MADPLLPALVYGNIEDGDFLSVVLVNKTTKEELSSKTDSLGNYVFDAANFASGYTYGDEVELIIDELPRHSENITTANGDIRLK